jgi:protein-tyrosine phosphatase
VTAAPGPVEAAGVGGGTRVLIVCAANRCRSPMGAALLRRRAGERGEDLRVSSAGVSALDGEPVVPLAVAVLRDGWAIDIAGHRSRRLRAVDVDEANLIVAVERWIAQEVVLQSPWAASRTFTLRGLARLATSTPRAPQEPTASWVERMDRREPVDVRLFSTAGDDIADPINGSIDDYRRTASELDALTIAILGRP